MGTFSRWPFLRCYPEMAAHPDDDKDRDVWRPDGKRFGRRLYVWEGATVFLSSSGLTLLVGPAGV